MIDSAGDLIEPVIRTVGKIIGGALRVAAEILLKALPDIFGAVFSSYFDALQRRGWSAWICIPFALISALLTIVVPSALAFVGAFIFFGFM